MTLFGSEFRLFNQNSLLLNFVNSKIKLNYFE